MGARQMSCVGTKARTRRTNLRRRMCAHSETQIITGFPHASERHGTRHLDEVGMALARHLRYETRQGSPLATTPI